MLLPITLTLAASCAFVNFWLAARCTGLRMKGALHGDGGNPMLARRMRAHANFTEYAPITVVLFLGVELALGSSLWLWIATVVFALARIAHGFGMDADKPTPWRAGGILLTWIVMLGLAVTALYAAYGTTREMPVPPAMAASL